MISIYIQYKDDGKVVSFSDSELTVDALNQASVSVGDTDYEHLQQNWDAKYDGVTLSIAKPARIQRKEDIAGYVSTIQDQMMSGDANVNDVANLILSFLS